MGFVPILFKNFCPTKSIHMARCIKKIYNTIKKMHNVVPKNFDFIFPKHICILICACKYPFVRVHIFIHKCILCTNVFAKCADNPKVYNNM
jgi:hypothetical protein